MLSLNEQLSVRPYTFDTQSQYVSKITLEVDFLLKNATTQEPYDTDEMAREFLMQFPNQAFSVNQTVSRMIYQNNATFPVNIARLDLNSWTRKSCN